jgi:hypothetical protein
LVGVYAALTLLGEDLTDRWRRSLLQAPIAERAVAAESLPRA